MQISAAVGHPYRIFGIDIKARWTLQRRVGDRADLCMLRIVDRDVVRAIVGYVNIARRIDADRRRVGHAGRDGVPVCKTRPVLVDAAEQVRDIDVAVPVDAGSIGIGKLWRLRRRGGFRPMRLETINQAGHGGPRALRELRREPRREARFARGLRGGRRREAE